MIASEGEVGALYGAFHLLRLVQTLRPIDDLDIGQTPRLRLRVLDHWDNLDGSIERGYAGRSLWDWKALPETAGPALPRLRPRQRLDRHQRRGAQQRERRRSEVLTAAYLHKVAALADVFRPYGIRVYLSARFTAPIELGGLKTADPLDPAVDAWWKEKADEIYRLIPDFGGFLVKANSEGQPGPQDYGRTHADGANVLADALAPHGGIVMWRAFVYDPKSRLRPGASRPTTSSSRSTGSSRPTCWCRSRTARSTSSRASRSTRSSAPCRTRRSMLEVQITQEYLGAREPPRLPRARCGRNASTSDTYATGPGSTVARVVDGSLSDHHPLTGIAGVANIGTDRNWMRPPASTRPTGTPSAASPGTPTSRAADRRRVDRT